MAEFTGVLSDKVLTNIINNRDVMELNRLFSYYNFIDNLKINESSKKVNLSYSCSSSEQDRMVDIQQLLHEVAIALCVNGGHQDVKKGCL